jgi:uncharacterized membrane protein
MPSAETVQLKPEARENSFLAEARRHKTLALLLLALGFALRFWNAAYRFFNADEILHYFLSVQPSLLATYRASLTTAHPPLLIVVLHYWGALGHSELFLRLPSVLAGTGFCWLMYRWLKLVTDETTSLIGLVLFLFSPALIIVSAEVRQYGLLLLFSGLSLYFLEYAIQRNSARCMLLSALSLYFALLSHYSSLIVALAIGMYALVRLASTRARAGLVSAWVAGQLGALALVGFLFTHHVPMLRARGAPEAIADTYLRRSVFQPGQDHVMLFVARSNIRLFHYLFSQAAVGVVALLLFVIAIVFLFRGKRSANNDLRPLDWQLALLFALPLVVNCALATLRVYPYGGTRHNSYLSMFAFPAIAVALSRWKPQWTAQKLTVVALILLVCNVFPTPLGEYIPIKDQGRTRMAKAMNSLNAVPAGSVIFTDHEGGLMLSYYLCHDKVVQLAQPLSRLLTEGCGRFSVVSVGEWIFKDDTFEPDLRDARHLYGWKSGTPLWFFQAGWFIDKEALLRDELRQAGCTAPREFGKNIFLCRITVP